MIFRILHVDVYPCMRHSVFCNVYQEIFKYPVSALGIQRKDHFLFRKLPAERQVCGIDLILKFQLYLAEKTDNVYIYDMKLDSFTCSFADLEEVFDEQFQPVGFLIQNLDIFLLGLPGKIGLF